METKDVVRLVQSTGSIITNHGRVPQTSGKARSLWSTRSTWLGTALVVIVCSVAVIATSTAPMASSSTLTPYGGSLQGPYSAWRTSFVPFPAAVATKSDTGSDQQCQSPQSWRACMRKAGSLQGPCSAWRTSFVPFRPR